MNGFNENFASFGYMVTKPKELVLNDWDLN